MRARAQTGDRWTRVATHHHILHGEEGEPWRSLKMFTRPESGFLWTSLAWHSFSSLGVYLDYYTRPEWRRSEKPSDFKEEETVGLAFVAVYWLDRLLLLAKKTVNWVAIRNVCRVEKQWPARVQDKYMDEQLNWRTIMDVYTELYCIMKEETPWMVAVLWSANWWLIRTCLLLLLLLFVVTWMDL